MSGSTTGIFAAGAGNVSVYAGQVTGGTRGIVAANQGTGANGKVVIDVTGPVVSQSSFGIIGVNNGTLAANSITINVDTTGVADWVSGGTGSYVGSQTAVNQFRNNL